MTRTEPRQRRRAGAGVGRSGVSQINSIFSNVRKVASLVRLTPFDVSSPEGRSKERHRRIVLSAVVAFVARVINAVSLFAVVRLTVGYLGTDRYGLWMTLTSLATFLGFVDLGVTQALVTLLARSEGRAEGAGSVTLVSSALAVLVAGAGLLIVGVLVIYPWVDWGPALGAASVEAGREAGPVLLVIVLGAVVGLPLSLASAVRLGLQQNYLSSLWQAAGSLVGLVAILVATRMMAGLVVLAAIPVTVQLCLGAADSGLLFLKQRPELRPRIRAFTRDALHRLMSLGGLFFVLGLTRGIGFSSDNLVLAKILGASAVTEYSVPQRLFSLTPLLLTFVLAPLWPAYAEAKARGDVQWIRNTLRRSTALTVGISVPLTITLVVFGPQIVTAWVGRVVQPSPTLLVGVGLSSALMTLCGVPAMFLNGMGVVRFQVVTAVAMAAVNLGLSIFLTAVIGTAGVAFGTAISMFGCLLVPSVVYIRRELRIIGTGAGSAERAGMAAGAEPESN